MNMVDKIERHACLRWTQAVYVDNHAHRDYWNRVLARCVKQRKLRKT